MSRQRLKILAAGAILVAGFAVAILFFRQVRQRPAADFAAKSQDVVLRETFHPQVEEESATPHLSGRIEPITAPAAAAPAPSAAAPSADPLAAEAAAPLVSTPPQMADRYQSSLPEGVSPTDPFQTAVDRKPPPPPRSGAGQPRYRRHVIRDGDTLAGLAERYLGDSTRQSEILALNRETLRASDVLPIGAVLRIPPGSAGAPAAAPSATPIASPAPVVPAGPPEEPLVPVPNAPPEAPPVVSTSTPVAPQVQIPGDDDGWRSAPSP
jgi:hypothetical protein